MAEEKKKPPGWNLDPVEAAIILIFLLAFAGYLVPAIANYFISGEATFYGFKLSTIFDFFKNSAWFFKMLGFVLAGGFLVGTVVLNKAADSVVREARAKMFPVKSVEPVASTEINQSVTRWQRIVALSESANPAEWRLSIIEADIILDELLQTLRLPGETMGDKLKAVEPSDFLTLDNAWEAHKARNMIAHEGDFLLNQREARRIISLYESVFREFELI